MKKSVNNFAEYKKVLNFAVRFNRNETKFSYYILYLR